MEYHDGMLVNSSAIEGVHNDSFLGIEIRDHDTVEIFPN